MRLGPRPTHTTQPRVVWDPGLGPTRVNATGGGVPVQPRARGSILSSAGRLRAPPSLSYPQPPSHPVDQPTDHPTDQPPAPKPDRAPDKHPKQYLEDPSHSKEMFVNYWT
ncbi:hypothetical protein PGT21_037297 [Puccinia graminis f. sp. tritici]|uniref:Uncharacterized protein n=1 Tax=Puccinia graminis f. sp. tritici TaxID=56615 RepID=A0A5B0R408_PUCGR|nr:hypothetical protein PGT21_037297 [Puccinia graminis f. sp. tritici]